MSNDNRYTSFDLMRIFGIKKGSWYNVKNKFELDKYSEQVLEGKQVKFVYSEEAYNILKENYQQKIVKEVKENPKMLSLIQDNETLKATLSEYKNLSSKFEKMYEAEKEERLKEIEISNKKDIQITQLKADYNRVQDNWKNSNAEVLRLKEENERLKNRGFFARLFNK